MGKKIKNINYRQFLDKGLIEFVTVEQLDQALKNIGSGYNKHKNEGRALLICLYYTGGRPTEVLDLRAKDISKDKGAYIKVWLRGAKGGLPRTIYLPARLRLVKELYNYASSIYPDQYAFFNYRGSYKRRVNLRSGVKIRTETSDRLRYYVKKWFKGVIDDSITPYFLRHSRFSQLSEAGVSIENIRFMKGARSVESVMPYLHLSTHKAKAISKKIK